ncbi:7-cyano-7-deazaguanine synthase [Gimesia panareensis]|uniref:7-cyano-7-deazaguanine synthase n=1 Tax=Gimesia panareensis TaxID=2527978 RepID=A0A517Q8B6_9PLAN|nr:Qat anti-phage system QueC-like protein QatC [Gimesia panareensis]QDT27860.1 7-cyano-7-deazaguanine synthase [Gimesia panareensis]
MTIDISLTVNPSKPTLHECARITVRTSSGLSSQVKIDFKTLCKGLNSPNAETQDFLLFGAVVYAADKLVPREKTKDLWTRDIHVTLSVDDPDRWTSLATEIDNCIGFLTGDNWRFSFKKRRRRLVVPRKLKIKRKTEPILADAACLFSGGLDSLAGAIDWLESNDGRLALVGHHDTRVAGPLSDQKRLLESLTKKYEGRIESKLIAVGQEPPGSELTFRSRSALFLGLGMFVINALNKDMDLLVPENGTIALNCPLTPSRRGSCSTRTAHPRFLSEIQAIAKGLGMKGAITNPLLGKTKGEVVACCQNLEFLKTVALDSVSCAQRGHKRWWKNRKARQCGSCMPCIYRRASLHSVDLDTESYGDNVCRGWARLKDSSSVAPNDFRACLSFLYRNPTEDEIARMLATNGEHDVSELRSYAATVHRAMDEIKQWLLAKATNDILRRGGLDRNAN